MKLTDKDALRVLTECSIMVALSTVLSIVKLFEMPYGGSITLASMLPIVIIAYRHGAKIGMGSALTASVIQMLLGLKNFSYFTTWYSIIALAVFDYVLAFAIFGLSGIFRRHTKNQSVAMTSGALLASVARYVCHVISGATVWAGLSIPDEAAILYSLSYNATYMIPETIILVLTAAYIGSSLDFRTRVPMRMMGEKLDTVSSYCLVGAGLAILSGLIADTVIIFSKLQSEAGEMYGSGLGEVNWIAVAIVTASCLCVGGALVIIARSRSKRGDKT